MTVTDGRPARKIISSVFHGAGHAEGAAPLPAGAGVGAAAGAAGLGPIEAVTAIRAAAMPPAAEHGDPAVRADR